MSYKTDNAIIMAAGTSSRFAPLSHEMPKGLIEVKGEVLIERQIRQLRDAGIDQILLVTGYMGDRFRYLQEKFGVTLVENPEYLTRNNNSSLWAARDYLRNSYVCSSDNYFSENPFEAEVDDAYYAAVYADGATNEWCMTEDADGFIDSVTIGGSNAWYMMGHTFWSQPFSERFLAILTREYDRPETADKLWEKIFMAHLDELKMRIRRYPASAIFEFDTLDELRLFDRSYVDDTRSPILKGVARELGCSEREIVDVHSYHDGDNSAAGFRFRTAGGQYEFNYKTNKLRRI